jgi:hypothetical protein
VLLIPSARAKTYTDNNLDIRYTIPNEWKIVKISDLQKLVLENNFSQSTIESFNVGISLHKKYNSTYIIMPDPEKDVTGSYLSLLNFPVDNKEIDTLDAFAEGYENETGNKLTNYTNNKANYIVGTTENGNQFNDTYLTLINGKMYAIKYVYNDTRYLSNKEVENFIDTIEYGIKSTSSNEQSENLDENTSSSNETNSKIIVDDGKGNITTETIVIGSNQKYYTKNFLIKIIGTIIFVILAVITAKERKFKLVSAIGWLLIIFQVIKCITTDSLLVTKDKIEILYTIVYFLPSIIGLILLSKSDFKMLNSYGISNNVSNETNDQSNQIPNNLVNNQTSIKNISVNNQENLINDNKNVETSNNIVSDINNSTTEQINKNNLNQL